MDPEDLVIEIRSGLGKIGQVSMDDVTDLKLNKRFNNVGSWSLSLPAETEAAQKLAQPGRGIVVTSAFSDLPIFTGSVVNYTNDQNTDDLIGIMTYTGADDNKHLADALAWPDPTNDDASAQRYSNDIRTGIAEDIIREYVSYNIGDPYADDPAAPHTEWGSNNRKVAGVTLQPVSAHQGNVVTGNARFDQLGKLIGDIALAGGVGFDLVQVSSTRKELQIYTPQDKSSYIRMDLDNDLLDKTSYGFGAPTATRVVMAGQGDGVNRQLMLITSPEAAAAEDAWGFKVETFKDRRDTNDVNELIQDGTSVVAENGKTITSLSVTPSDNVAMVYGKDWFLGDIVGVNVADQPLQAVVTEATISITEDGLLVAATIGDPTGFDYDSKIIAAQQNQETRLAFLEKNAEVGQILQTGIVDPLWTVGLPTVTFDGASGSVTVSGWTGEGGYQPNPGDHVLVARSGEDWYISGPVVSTLPLMNQIPLPFQNGWMNYDPTWQSGAFTKTSDGIVVLSGLIKPANSASAPVRTTIAQLPIGFRPDYDLVFDVNNTDTWRSLVVLATGEIQMITNNGSNTAFINLDGIAFPAAGVANWQSMLEGASITLVNGFVQTLTGTGKHAGLNYPPLRYWKDDANGLVWWQGMLLHPVAVTTDNTTMLTFPAEIAAESREHHFASETDDAWGAVGINSLNSYSSLNWKIGNQTSNTQLSLNRVIYPQASQMSGFTYPALGSSWVIGSPSTQFTLPGYKQLANKLVYVQGFMNSGSVNTASKIWTQPAGTRPSGTNGTGAAGAMFNRPSNGATRARILGDGNGAWSVEQANNGWVSLDGIIYAPRS